MGKVSATNPPKLHFADWHESFITRVVEYLRAWDSQMDYGPLVLVLPGGRVGRQIQGRLAVEAAQRKCLLNPPEILTPGALADRLVGLDLDEGAAGGRMAPSLVQELAWAQALLRVPEDVRKILFPKDPVAAGGGRDGGVMGDESAAGADLVGWCAAGATLARCRQELAAGRWSFAAVADKALAGGAEGVIREAERWQAAAAVEAAYLEYLGALGFADPQVRRERAIQTGRVCVPGDGVGKQGRQILLAGIGELNPQLRAMLEVVAGQVEVLVYAPVEMGACFDAWGCIVSGAWAEVALPLEQVECVVAQGPGDMARAAFGIIGKLGDQGRGMRADQITMGVLDESLVGYLQTQAENLGDPERASDARVDGSAGIAVRYGAGVRMEQTRPYKLLELAAAFLETRQFRDLVGLVRHPNLQEWLRGRFEEIQKSRPTGAPAPQGMAPGAVSQRPSGWRDWLTLLDRYGSNYLPDVLDESCAAAGGWRSSQHDDVNDPADLAWLYRMVGEFLNCGEAGGGAGGRPALRARRTLHAWAKPIAQLLLRGFGSEEWDQSRPEARVVVQSCLALRAALGELYEFPEVSAGGGAVQVTYEQALRLVLREAAGQGRLVEGNGGGDGGAIEMIGWLELLPDDADHLVIVGFNEGRVPEALGLDPFLNSQVRQVLGLTDDAARYARDAYSFYAMIAGRPANTKGGVHVVVGCTSAQGDPLLPSRLLFAYGGGAEGGGGEVAQRLARQVVALTEESRLVRPNLVERFGQGEQRIRDISPSNMPGGAPAPQGMAPGVNSPSPGGGFGIFALPPRERIRVLTHLRVTAFRDYLASPRLFYLKHVRRLEEVEAQTPRELAAMPVGSLIHRVLEAFGRELVVERERRGGGVDISAERFAARLGELLEAHVTTWYGRNPPASVRVQAKLLWPRLEGFAQWQATWMQEGWQPLHLEWSAPMSSEAGGESGGGSPLLVDGQPMLLRGKIDRIDQHRTGELALLDYKLCRDESKTPESTHRRSRKGGVWMDLQLPLYRHVARVVIGAQPVKLGFIRLADKLEAVGVALADWTAEDLAQADAAAAEVVRGIRRRDYEAIGKDPPQEGVFGYLLGQGYLTVGEAGGTGAESEGGSDE